MTTVVYKNGYIAVDSLTLAGDILFSNRAQKIKDLGNGNFMAGTGVVSASQKLADYIKKNGLVDLHLSEIKNKDNQYICWYGKQLYMIDSELHPMKLDLKNVYAFGSGREVALGVLHSPRTTAQDAVKVAIKLDVYSGGKVRFRQCV